MGGVEVADAADHEGWVEAVASGVAGELYDAYDGGGEGVGWRISGNWMGDLYEYRG